MSGGTRGPNSVFISAALLPLMSEMFSQSWSVCSVRSASLLQPRPENTLSFVSVILCPLSGFSVKASTFLWGSDQTRLVQTTKHLWDHYLPRNKRTFLCFPHILQLCSLSAYLQPKQSSVITFFGYKGNFVDQRSPETTKSLNLQTKTETKHPETFWSRNPEGKGQRLLQLVVLIVFWQHFLSVMIKFDVTT